MMYFIDQNKLKVNHLKSLDLQDVDMLFWIRITQLKSNLTLQYLKINYCGSKESNDHKIISIAEEILHLDDDSLTKLRIRENNKLFNYLETIEISSRFKSNLILNENSKFMSNINRC